MYLYATYNSYIKRLICNDVVMDLYNTNIIISFNKLNINILKMFTLLIQECNNRIYYLNRRVY